ncbi:hypothetical protein P8452_58826 [Trifolium repens]|nr:hypothetical protein P8452_58826 [Trifolium repens]
MLKRIKESSTVSNQILRSVSRPIPQVSRRGKIFNVETLSKESHSRTTKSGLGLNEMCGCCKKDFGADYEVKFSFLKPESPSPKSVGSIG